jgi:hypothetical protein
MRQPPALSTLRFAPDHIGFESRPRCKRKTRDAGLSRAVCRRLVPDASAPTTAERHCENDGDDDQGDDNGAGEEQSAIHGDLLGRMTCPSPTTDACGRQFFPGRNS